MGSVCEAGGATAYPQSGQQAGQGTSLVVHMVPAGGPAKDGNVWLSFTPAGGRGCDLTLELLSPLSSIVWKRY